MKPEEEKQPKEHEVDPLVEQRAEELQYRLYVFMLGGLAWFVLCVVTVVLLRQ